LLWVLKTNRDSLSFPQCTAAFGDLTPVSLPPPLCFSYCLCAFGAKSAKFNFVLLFVS